MTWFEQNPNKTVIYYWLLGAVLLFAMFTIFPDPIAIMVLVFILGAGLYILCALNLRWKDRSLIHFVLWLIGLPFLMGAGLWGPFGSAIALNIGVIIILCLGNKRTT